MFWPLHWSLCMIDILHFDSIIISYSYLTADLKSLCSYYLTKSTKFQVFR